MINMGGIRKKASVVFYLIDQFTGQGVKTANITLLAQSTPYVNKQDGCYVYANLPSGNYTFVIEAPNYVTTEIDVLLSGDGPAVMQVQLQHHLSSKLLNNTTRIISSVQDRKGKPIKNEQIHAALVSSITYMRLMETAKKGEEMIKPYSKEGLLLEGKKLLIMEAKANEIIEIQRYQEGQDCYNLAGKLQNTFSSGTLLYPVWELKTDDQGRFILPVPANLAAEEKTVELKVFYGNKLGSLQHQLLPGKITTANIFI